ncbi:MAG: methyltransferase domain-containing protein [Segetibacter sp.]
MNAGFKDVTMSDFSHNSLSMANILAPQLKTVLLNAEALELEPNAYDLIVVQDGLHHLPRPAIGFTEMLRVAKKAVMVIEPYDSLVGNVIGTEWEVHGSAINYVYRWNRKMIEQTVKSYLLREYDVIKVFRFWDHNSVIHKLVNKLPKRFRISSAKIIYSLLSLINFSGNMMVAIVTKKFD